MSKVERVKVGSRVINLDRVIFAEKDENPNGWTTVRVYPTIIEGDFSVGGVGSVGQDYFVLQGEEAQAFWKFYTSHIYGCLDVMTYFAPTPQVVEISDLQGDV